MEDCVGMPCPNCGSNLLTQADYDNVIALIEMIDNLNKILPKSDVNDGKVLMTYHHHDGQTKIEIKPDDQS